MVAVPSHYRRSTHAMTTTVTVPPTRFRTVDDVSVRYADSGGAGPTVLLTSPWPESLYAFAPVWSRLAPHARLFAVDLPGFGRSERRDDLMSPRAMGGFLTRLVAQADLERPYVVAPDVGTAAALFAAAAEPERFSGLVIGGGGTAVPLQLGEPLASWVLDPDLDRYRQVDPRLIVNRAVDNHAGDVPDDIRADYLASYEGDRFVESMRYVRRYPEELPVLADLLPDLQVPITVVSGRHDHVVPLANATFVADRAPRVETVVLDAGHFLWEEVPDQYADAVLAAMSSAE
jgi:pimeloyl-ACP methyl ester carboxylesterase